MMPWYATECPANLLSDRVVKPPFASEVSLGGLHGDVSQWELELFQLTTRLMRKERGRLTLAKVRHYRSSPLVPAIIPEDLWDDG